MVPYHPPTVVQYTLPRNNMLNHWRVWIQASSGGSSKRALLPLSITPFWTTRGVAHWDLTPRRSYHSSSGTTNSDSKDKNTKRRRKRHNFDLQQVPSFAAFQRQQSVRTLYRQFLRLTYRQAAPARHDLTVQVRREFRQPLVGGPDDPWAVKRAMSEGTRRYKELTAMLSSVPNSTDKQNNSMDKGSNSSTTTTGRSNSPANRDASPWPWQAKKSTLSSKPLSFPKR